jgi:tetratricopeptide (TPR) repeat protein
MKQAIVVRSGAPAGRFRSAAAILAAFISVVSAFAASTEVTVTVKDEAGAIQPGTTVSLTARDDKDHGMAQAPWKATTSKKGSATFPFLPYNSQGLGRYGLALVKEGWFIRHFKIESRQITNASDYTGTLVQSEDSASSPTQQDKIPSVIAKPGGRVTIELVIARIDSYRGGAAPAAAGAAGGEGAAAAPPPAAAPAAPPPPADPIEQAKLLMAGKKLDEAEAVLTPLKETKPSASLDYAFATLHHLRGNEDDAAASLRAALAKDPTYPKAHYMLGRKAYEEGRTDEAITHFEAETKAHPDDETSLSTLASLYMESGRTDDAVKVYEAIVAANPGNTDALVSLDGLYTSMGNQQKSDETFQKVLAANPTGADQVYFRVGAGIMKRQDLSEAERHRAIAAFEKAVKLNPKNDKAHRELGMALVGVNKMDEAKVHFKRYLELSPTASDAATIKSFLTGM